MRTDDAPRWQLAPAVIGWLAAGVVLLALGMLTRRPDIAAIGVPLLLGVAWSTSGRPRRRPAAQLRGQDQPIGASDVVAAEVVIEPAELPTALALRVRAPGHRPGEALVAAEPRTLTVSIRTVRTGRRELFRLAHRAVGVDALLSAAAVSDPSATMTILPSARALAELPLPFRLQGLTGPHASRRAGTGGDLHDVALFTPGDRLRRIDWRVTARLNTAPAVLGRPDASAGNSGADGSAARYPPVGRQAAGSATDVGDNPAAIGASRPNPTITRLYVRRTFATADATVMLVIDSRDQVGPRVSSWGDATLLREDESTSLDIARHAAVSLARQYLAAGDRVGLEDLGKLRRPAPPAGGRRQLQLLTQQLALSEPEGEPTHRERIPRLPSGALIVVFSTFLDDDAALLAQAWRRAGHRVLAVDTMPRLLVSGIPERLWIAYRIIAMERADRITRLAAAGIETLAWMDPGHDPGLELDLMARVRGRR
ncbi:MAG: DUF58 domain-containing protein [Microlunatus sp.]